MSIPPGPYEGSVLSLQREHRSEDVWTRDSCSMQPLKCRQGIRHYAPQDERVVYYVRLAGFYGVHRLISTFEMDMSFITALVERWRPETHTFHLLVGEATITLEDVAVLLGLRVDGEPVTGTAAHDWVKVIEELLGVVPPEKYLVGSSLRIQWLREHFASLPVDADEDTVKFYARAYILQLMGKILFGDVSGKNVQLLYLPLLADFEEANTYSWGSAALAYMYRNLCRAAHRGKTDIAGPLILIQLWAWERMEIVRPTCTFIPIDGDARIARNVARRKASREARDLVGNEKPTFGSQFISGDDSLARRWIHCSYSYKHSSRSLEYYRDILDRQLEAEFIWVPYTRDVLERLPEICRSGAHIYMTEAPLICFDIVEWHRPGRVMRQFGFPPAIPHDCDYDKQLHKVDRRGKLDYNWADYHGKFVKLWNERTSSIVTSQPLHVPKIQAFLQYMSWFTTITRRFISPPGLNPVGHHQPAAPDLHMMGQYVFNTLIYGRQMAYTTQHVHISQDLDGLSQNVNTFCNYLSTESSNIMTRTAVDPFVFRGVSATVGALSCMPTPEVPRSSHPSQSFSTPPPDMSPSGDSPSAFTPLGFASYSVQPMMGFSGTPAQPDAFASPPLPHYAQYRDPDIDLGEPHVSVPRPLSPINEDASTSRGERKRGRRGRKKTT